MKKLTKIVAVTFICALTLVGCGETKQPKMIDMIETGSILPIEVIEPEGTFVKKISDKPTEWLPLDLLSTYTKSGFRSAFDRAFNINKVIVGNRGSKQGCIYTQSQFGGEDRQDGNSTLRQAFRNEQFIKYYNNPEVLANATSEIGKVYTDLTETGASSSIAALNAYFNLMSDSPEDDTFGGNQLLTREQFYTLLYKAEMGAEDLENSSSASIGNTEYSKFVHIVSGRGWLNPEDGSLNSDNISKPISKLEVLYLLTNSYFSDLVTKVELPKNASAFNLYLAEGLEDRIMVYSDSASSAWENNVLAYVFAHMDIGAPKSLIRPLYVAEQLGIMKGLDSTLTAGITKEESIRLLINVYLAENRECGYLTTEEYPEIDPKHQDDIYNTLSGLIINDNTGVTEPVDGVDVGDAGLADDVEDVGLAGSDIGLTDDVGLAGSTPEGSSEVPADKPTPKTKEKQSNPAPVQEDYSDLPEFLRPTDNSDLPTIADQVGKGGSDGGVESDVEFK